MATRTCTTIRVQRSAIQLSGPVKREVHEQDLASVISTYTTASWMAVCYCQPAYCLQTGNGRLSTCAKINLLTRHLKTLWEVEMNNKFNKYHHCMSLLMHVDHIIWSGWQG